MTRPVLQPWHCYSHVTTVVHSHQYPAHATALQASSPSSSSSSSCSVRPGSSVHSCIPASTCYRCDTCPRVDGGHTRHQQPAPCLPSSCLNTPPTLNPTMPPKPKSPHLPYAPLAPMQIPLLASQPRTSAPWYPCRQAGLPGHASRYRHHHRVHDVIAGA